MRNFNIVVIGTINRDTIIFSDGKRIESFGGILYNILSLSYLGRETVRIYPVCNLGYDVYDQVMSRLKGSHNVELAGIQKVDRKNNHALLSVNKENEREEILTNRVPPLGYAQIKPFVKADVILVNFISGSDLSLKTLKRIRKETDALVFMDVHSLTLGVQKSGKRFLHAPRSWREWVRQTDMVQMNLPELNELAKTNLKSDQEVREFGKYILNLGPRAALVTLAEEGALMICDNKVQRSKGSKVQRFKDATGCGDVFSAGFLVSYLITKDLAKSVNFANRVAAAKCRVSGTERMKKLFEKITIDV